MSKGGGVSKCEHFFRSAQELLSFAKLCCRVNGDEATQSLKDINKKVTKFVELRNKTESSNLAFMYIFALSVAAWKPFRLTNGLQLMIIFSDVYTYYVIDS